MAFAAFMPVLSATTPIAGESKHHWRQESLDIALFNAVKQNNRVMVLPLIETGASIRYVNMKKGEDKGKSLIDIAPDDQMRELLFSLGARSIKSQKISPYKTSRRLQHLAAKNSAFEDTSFKKRQHQRVLSKQRLQRAKKTELERKINTNRLVEAVRKGKVWEVAQRIREANVNTCDENGRSLIEIAFCAGYTEMINLLVTKGGVLPEHQRPNPQVDMAPMAAEGLLGVVPILQSSRQLQLQAAQRRTQQANYVKKHPLRRTSWLDPQVVTSAFPRN